MNKKTGLIFLNKFGVKERLSLKKTPKFIMLGSSIRCELLRQDFIKRGFIEIEKERINDQRLNGFNWKYIEFIGNLNKLNTNKIIWHAFSFTSKNYFLSQLPERIYKLLVILNIIEGFRGDLICIIEDDFDFVKSVQSILNDKDISLRNFVTWQDIKVAIKSYIPFLKTVKCFFTEFLRLIYIKFFWRKNFLLSNRYSCVLKTFIDHQSFDCRRNFSDTFFAPLVKHFERQDVSYLFCAHIFPKWRLNINKILKYNNIIPENYFLSFWDLVKCLFFSFRKFKIGKVYFGHTEVTELIKTEIKKDRKEGRVFSNYRSYLCMEEFIKNVNFFNLIYIFENQCWEKMILMALKMSGKNIKTIGFLHSVIQMKHLNYFMSKDEINHIPHPDKIVTAGKIIKDLLEKYGNYLPNSLYEGCALRQNKLIGSFQKQGTIERVKKSKKTCLVALKGKFDEDLRLINFIKLLKNDFNIIIKTHPLSDLEKIINLSQITRYSNVKLFSKESLIKLFNKSDFVIYSSSPVCIEALYFGLPIIFVDLKEYLNADPLFDFNLFKWTVKSPEELSMTIKYIESIPDEKYLEFQKEAAQYARFYLSPITDDRLKVFYE